MLMMLLVGLCGSSVAAEERYSMPQGAQHQQHVRLSNMGEQDYFEISRPYPSTYVLDHYRKVFKRWTECKPEETWRSFGDVSGSKPRFIHQLVREWLRSDNHSVVTLAIRYYSTGAQHRALPDDDIQHVVLIEYEVPDAKAMAEQRGYKCNGA